MNDQMQIESTEVHVNMRAGHWCFFFWKANVSTGTARHCTSQALTEVPPGTPTYRDAAVGLVLLYRKRNTVLGKSCRIYMSSSHLETQLPSRNTDPVRLHFHDQSPHSWTTNMSFSFYVRLIRKHDGTAKRNQMRQFACQDIVDLETYDLRTCGVASAEIMFKIKSCSNPITYMRNAFDVLHGVLMKKNGWYIRPETLTGLIAIRSIYVALYTLTAALIIIWRANFQELWRCSICDQR